MTVSEDFFRDAYKSLANNAFLGQLEQATKDMIDTTSAAKRVAELENAQVYLEKPPIYSTLPLISRQSLSKPLAISSVAPAAMVSSIITSPDHLNLFAGLFPKPVTETLVQIKEYFMMNQAMASQIAASDTQEAKNALASVGLPGKVKTYWQKDEGTVQIPEELWAKVKSNQQLGGLSDIRSRLNDLFTNSKKITDSVDEIERVIKEEISKDGRFQTNYFGTAAVANMPKTEELINERVGKPNQKSLRDNLEQLQGTYLLSQNSDLLLINNMIKGGDLPSEGARRNVLADMLLKGKYADWFSSVLGDIR